MEDICSIPECGKKIMARRWCSAHYTRFIRYGNPLAGGTKWGNPRAFFDEAAQSDSDECILWPFGRESHGYPNIYHEGKSVRAHRLMCRQVHGNPPNEKYDTAHSCGNGHLGCINPRHLRWDTRSGNQADRVKHGTSNRGEQCAASKLTREQVREIRELKATHSLRELSELYGVSSSHISEIVLRKNWAWLK